MKRGLLSSVLTGSIVLGAVVVYQRFDVAVNRDEAGGQMALQLASRELQPDRKDARVKTNQHPESVPGRIGVGNEFPARIALPLAKITEDQIQIQYVDDAVAVEVAGIDRNRATRRRQQ